MFKIPFLTVIMSVLFLWLVTSNAGDAVILYGVEIPKADEGTGATKAVFVSKHSYLYGPLMQKVEIGGWVDNAGQGRHHSMIGGYSVGFDVRAGYVFTEAMVGPSLISKTDSLLGGNLQFNNDVSFGVRDPNTGNAFGINYKHISSAGLSLPNKGRDFLMFRVSFGF